MTTKKYRKILELGLRLDLYMALEYVVEKVDISQLMEFTKFEDSLNQLENKDYVIRMKDGKYEATTKGVDTYKEVSSQKEAKAEKKPKVLPQNELVSLHTALKEKLKAITGQEQVKGFGNVPFIPSLSDFQDHIKQFLSKYPNLWDYEKVQKCLLEHVESCARKQSYSPCIKYFIHKRDSGSTLAAYLETTSGTAGTEQYRIIETNNLFD